MDAKVRFVIVLAVMVFSLLLKWFIPRFVATQQLCRLCLRLFGELPEVPSFGRLVRLLGWDISNAALGLMVLACILEGSNFRHCLKSLGNYDFIAAILCFFIFIGLYGVAIETRYIFLETAERVGTGRILNGLVLWFVGLLMLLNSSWFVVGK